MFRNPIFIAFIFYFCISGIENKDFNGFTSKLSKYSIVKPQVINNKWTRSIHRTSQTKETYGEKASYTLKINNREHILHLQKNRDFLHPNFVQYSRDASGNYNASYPKHVHCYYHGSVEGYENSMVALSTCSGLRGVILLENETFGLEPVPQSTTNEHVLYLLKDSHSEPVSCGVIGEAASAPSYEPFEPAQSMTSLLRKKRRLPQTSYVELVLVVDNLRYIYKKRNDTAVREEMVQMANLLDGYYKPLNIRVVLVGLEVFKESNPFSVDGSAGDVLGAFVNWRKSTLLPKIRHDIGQLIVGQPKAYGGGVLGMAFVGTVCSVATSGGINVFSENNLNFVSTVVAHEMGHNLGMNHDYSGCSCDRNSCIMSGGASGSPQFSDCSARDFEALILRGGGVCLRNPPPASNVIGSAECGNGRLDQGEECDCGSPKECKNVCCDAATCKLTRGSSCAHGYCCDKCQIQVSGTECRKSSDVCDLTEYCDGKSSFCPQDFYIMDGLPCKNNSAYCYEGRCQTYDYQCLNLFGSGAKKAEDICFQYENTKGNVFGNCGITSSGNYIKCTVANAKCGKVQCTDVNLDIHPVGAQISIQVVEGSRCFNADFNLGSDVLDPAYVKPGSPCDTGKTCVDFHCVNASVLLPKLDCDAQTTCNGQGVCNDKGHCHCDNGWAPPNCNTPGRGGSIDSGPAMIDYSLRNGLLIFFLLIVPLLIALILVLLYIFKRDSLDVCLKRRQKPRNTGNRNANAPANDSVQTNVTSQPPGQVPPARPPGPSVVSAPISGFRYGEVDYWNLETNVIPPRPQPPVQGPGVPRAIPVRDIPN
ncbi:disintegrin and metalloproteinase domain-containing protein 9 isoform X2 [Girardinichthys multiradiatus]|uniref:disintegrin and metalloproteinase domain-containing protein 9 isoform X2 n=1 Tax=Girardinichthys multiradiatus TaxID=208333 RepID=UPI001FAD3EDB|nr:disintegrin and metalloproteinase domain-containing protein 9 isoform X2 [Girardinichthys multiradiatus]